VEKHQKSFFSPKYRGKVLEGEVAEAAEELIRETCKERDIEIIDMAVNVDHVHLFIKNPFRKSVYKTFKKSFIKSVSQKCFAALQNILLAG
jgi:putative transposase